jgi:hypothetical protein
MNYRTLWLALVLIIAGTAPAMARPRVATFDGVGPGSVSVAIVPLAGGTQIQSTANAASADLGMVSANIHPTMPGVEIVRHARSYSIVTEIGLRASSGSLGTASVQAFVNPQVSGVSVRIDGIDLTSVPRVIATHVPMNVVTRHRMEIEVPNALRPEEVPSEFVLEFGGTLD